jgi:anti-sigma factor RsiW
MNCFEARRDFAAFWRRELTPERRAEFVAHLERCSKCERSFRVFALTAPALNSSSEPAARRAGVRAIDPAGTRGPAPAARSRRSDRPRWFAMCAAVTVFLAASLAAWLSVSVPTETLGDAIGKQDQPPMTDLFEPVAATTSDDFAG